MSWPYKNEHEVSCFGFPHKYFPAIKYAIDNQEVKWGKNSNLFMELYVAEFYWVGCTWEFTEMNERVTSIRLIEGIPNHEDLTVAILKI